ncbi:MAG: DUF86 domain-containing protein [Bacteroidales bacterium]|jgi:uncharacterized protein with HEPN domain|nr:DUF86 domain-containing protein [Bacteroidales bacterium]MBQ5551897.1 DUF86 domain-containing protein [Bacteroidales bacterium]
MREPIRDKERLTHINQAIGRIKRYTKDLSYDSFIADDMVYYAVVKNIEIIGEAANMLTAEFQIAHPKTPWKMIKGMRNYIVHEYFQIDSNVVWNVVTQNLPELEAQVTEYLSEG